MLQELRWAGHFLYTLTPTPQPVHRNWFLGYNIDTKFETIIQYT